MQVLYKQVKRNHTKTREEKHCILTESKFCDFMDNKYWFLTLIKFKFFCEIVRFVKALEMVISQEHIEVSNLQQLLKTKFRGGVPRHCTNILRIKYNKSFLQLFAA